jgi:hypothetical protein
MLVEGALKAWVILPTNAPEVPLAGARSAKLLGCDRDE